MRLSKWRYMTLHDFHIQEGLSNFPTYYKLAKEKKECYPHKDDVTVTDTSAKIKLQALLDLTAKRLLKSLTMDSSNDLIQHTKWGFDGASSQSVYHQRSSSSKDDLSTVFMARLVSLKLVDKENGNIVWQNERPSSTLYFRPISFKFMKDIETNVKTELGDFESEISLLTPTEYEHKSVTHNMMLTVIYDKVHSYISETSAAVCDLSKARPVEMNDLEVVKSKPVQEDLYKYGLSTLHAWIRSMKC